MSKPSKTPTPAVPKSKNARLTPAQWTEAETLWASGEVTLEDLANRFGKSTTAFGKHFKVKKIDRGTNSAKIQAQVKAEMEEVITEATVLAKRIKETKEEHYKMASGLARLTWAEILKAKNDGTSMAAIAPALKAIREAVTILRIAREDRFAVLGLDKDTVDTNELPELEVSDLTESQEAELRSRTSNEEIEDLDVSIEPAKPEKDDPAEEDDGEEVVSEGDGSK